MNYQSAVNILEKIRRVKIDEVAELKRRVTLDELREDAAGLPPCRGFAAALRAGRATGEPRRAGCMPRVIAEVKKASPSAGVIREDFDPAAIARSYEQHGAAAISCLTDTPHFQGSLEALRAVRGAVHVPVLRKEFMIDVHQVWEARLAGADAILLIAGMIGWSQQAALRDAAHEADMDVLLEIHGEEELEPALALEPDVLGINNRNLRTADLMTDLTVTERLAARIPQAVTLISESGIRTRADVQRLALSGIDGILVGEHLMRESDPGAAIDRLMLEERN